MSPQQAPPMPPNPADYPPGYAAADRGNSAIAVYWAECSIVILVIAARMSARHLNRALGVDDWFMFFTGLLFIGASGVITSLAKLGGFHHLLFVPMQNASEVGLQNMILQTLVILSFGTSKFSVGYFLLRILPPSSTWRRYFIWALISVTLAFNISEIVAQWLRCNPPSRGWNPMEPGTCWSDDTVLTNFTVGSIYNIVVDVILALLPISIVWKLNTSLQRRISLGVLLSLGLVAAACSAVKVSYGHTIVSKDMTWNTYDLNVWSGSEVFVIIVCGSMPPLATLWDRFVMKRLPSRSSKYDNTDQSSEDGYTKNSHSKHNTQGSVSSKASTERHSQETDVEKLSDEEILAITDIEISQEQKRLTPKAPIPGI